ncbi:PKD domain-containing protein [Cytophagaceae bacterium ABcell3]|nr:PKD domain-containing protein [Cytophagaceae bacterium ABcell3]
MTQRQSSNNTSMGGKLPFRFEMATYIISLVLLLLSNASYAQVDLLVSSKEVEVDETFYVDVKVDAGTQQIDGANVFLSFDQAHLEVLSINEGEDLNVQITPTSYDNDLGIVKYAYGIFSDFPSGDILLFTITFKALQAGESPLDFVSFDDIATDVTFGGYSVLEDKHGAVISILEQNIAPVADAGADQELVDESGEGVVEVELDGSGSTDEDGEIVSYSWTVDGEEIGTGVNPTVELPVGTTTIVLTVTDDDGDIATDEVVIVVNPRENIPPVADAGSDQELVDESGEGTVEVELDGSGSTDEDGEIVSYSWKVDGEEIAEGVNPTVELPVGTTTIVLTVTDDDGDTATDEVVIVVNPRENIPPVADAGSDQELVDESGEGTVEVELDGSGSTDEDGEIVSYSWKVDGEEIAEGVNPTVELPVGTTTIVLTVTDNDGDTATDEVDIVVNPRENIPPVADAGSDQELVDESGEGTVEVELDGSGSTDEDGEIVSYSWTVDGEEIGTGVNPTVELPVGTTTIVLTVTDDDGDIATDEVVIVVNPRENIPPVADAGSDQELVDESGEGTVEVELDGSGSTDEDGEIVSYSWKVDGEEIAEGVNPTVELPVGTTTIVLTVTDDDGDTATDEVVIVVNPRENIPPVADAGADQELVDESGEGVVEVELDGSGSTDEDGEIVSYSWTVDGEEIAEGINPTVELPVGTTTIVLTVTDDDGDTATDEVVIVVNPRENIPPVADAGSDQELVDESGEGIVEVELDGSGSTDEDGEIVSYSWSIDGEEIATGVNPTVDLPVGTNTIVLTVTDNDGDTATDEVVIVVNPRENIPPVADAGADQELVDESGEGIVEVELDGSGSTDEDGEIVSYSWSIDGEEIATGVNPTVELPVGTTSIVLTVTDDDGDTATDEVVVVIEVGTSIFSCVDCEEGLLNVYPNPSRGDFVVSVNQGMDSQGVVSVISTQGVVLRKISMQDFSQEGNVNIDLSMQPAGVYFIKFETPASQSMVKVFKL